MHDLITLVNDNQVDSYLKDILVFIYHGWIVNNSPKNWNNSSEYSEDVLVQK